MTQPRRVNLDEQAKLLSLTTEIVADGAITAPKLADDAVTNVAILDGTITANKFDPAVFGEGLVYNSLTNAIDVNIDLGEFEITADMLEIKPGGIHTIHLDIDADLDFHNHQSLNFRVENVVADPVPGNPGRLVWRTDLNEMHVDNGLAFVTLSLIDGHHVQDEGVLLPQRELLNFVGTGVTVIDTGTTTEIQIPFVAIEDEGNTLPQEPIINFVGSGVTVIDNGGKTQVSIPGGSSSYFKDELTVSNIITDHTIPLSNTPVPGSEIVSWNGLVLRYGVPNDYTISGTTLTLAAGITLTVGDQIQIAYAY